MSTSGLQESDPGTRGRSGFVSIARGIIPSAPQPLRPGFHASHAKHIHNCRF